MTTDNPHLNPKTTKIAGETVEEHNLRDRIAYERYLNQQTDQTAQPTPNKLGLGIFRTRIRHGRP